MHSKSSTDAVSEMVTIDSKLTSLLKTTKWDLEDTVVKDAWYLSTRAKLKDDKEAFIACSVGPDLVSVDGVLKKSMLPRYSKV